MTHLTYLEAGVVGRVQGISEMFPVSSLGHNVLIPALIGGSWRRTSTSPRRSRPTSRSSSACTSRPRSPW